jgi:ribonuclease T1
MAHGGLQNAKQRLRRYLLALCLAVSAALLPGFACAYSSPVGDELALGALPAEAQVTIERIRKGGPFPYHKDGVTFGNREQRLPFRPRGYYREYTVLTPGARDRGARRVIAGREGEYYYSDDHYRSFHRVHIQERK